MPPTRTSSLAGLFSTTGMPGSAAPAAPGTLTELERFRIRLRRRPLLLDGAMGTLLLLARRAPASLPRRARPDQAGSRVDDPPRVHRGRRGRDRDEHLRRQPLPPGRIRAREARRPAEPPRRSTRSRGARDVRQGSRSIAGSIGPLGPAAKLPRDRIPGSPGPHSARQIEGLLEGGVDLFVFETFDGSSSCFRRSRRPGGPAICP